MTGGAYQTVSLKVNGTAYRLAVDPGRTLLDVLRVDLGLTGTKRGCEVGECGACTVILDGRAVNACLVLIPQAEGGEVETVEGLAEDGRLHRLQEEFLRAGAVQCGFCTPGLLMSAKALLARTPHPTEGEIRAAIAGNLCRCTGYVQVVEAILNAAEEKP